VVGRRVCFRSTALTGRHIDRRWWTRRSVDLLAGLLLQETRSSPGGQPGHIYQNIPSFYAMDTYKVTSKLTLMPA